MILTFSEQVGVILKKRNTHRHNVFHILDEDTYQMSSATVHHKCYDGENGA
jgi:hypothetical protein